MRFFFHEGYWGPQVGFYGGINYGFGYGGVGYEGGRWEGDHFSYNTYVNHINTTIIHNTYNTTITNVSENHVSYNGGAGGVEARPTPQQESYANEHHAGLLRPMPHAATKRVRAMKLNQARELAQNTVPNLLPTLTITPANCTRISSRRQTPATPRPTRNISSSRTN
jgi:hypothetical protein